ncbi:MAG TPA: response regulator transcription factor, partial [Acidimicrobiales bacterium]|nr:response regulator transcription factor [Acidimicrobiales bacterium]
MAAPEDDPPGIDRLLIVEDHELLSGTLALALQQRGLRVEALNGPDREAVVRRAAELAPVLVLLDLDLGPALGNGVDLIRPLVAAGARVVIMSGDTSRPRLGACVEAGASGIVSKASRFDDLVEAVQRSADGRDLLPEGERLRLLAELRESRRASHERLAPFASLSPREQAVLARLMAGESAETIAEHSYVSLATVRSQIRAILLKLGVNSQLAAVALARDAGWSP